MAMKREIKFRFWIDNKPVIKSLSSFLMSDGTRENTLEGFHDPFNIEQFTGLKDKNGVDIYEGDIVKYDDDSNGRYWRVCTITWVKAHYKLIGYTFDTKTPEIKHAVDFDFGCFIYEYDGVLEVIGNIHQNPELI